MKNFFELIKPIIKDKKYIEQKKYVHHGSVSTYTHELTVAYICYKYALKHKSKVNMESLIKGALLHDYYLYDWHNTGEGHRLHGLRHPKFAYKNASRDFGPLNKIEKDVILHHMFPLVPVPPHTKEGWILTICDKRAARWDYKKRKKRQTK